MNWTPIYARLIRMIDLQGPAYLSGSQFLRLMRDVDPYIPQYNDFIKERGKGGKSTTRRDFFRDVLDEFDENRRLRAVYILLDNAEPVEPTMVTEIRALIGGQVPVPSVTIPDSAWNATRLNENLTLIDETIAIGEYERAITLIYTSLEGFMGAFVRAKYKREKYPNEITELAKEVRAYLKETIQEYPDEVLNLVKQIPNSIDRARNQFSEAHFGKEAGLWLATYLRDLLNSQIRLLLHFM
jgi:hypothetical protein